MLHVAVLVYIIQLILLAGVKGPKYYGLKQQLDKKCKISNGTSRISHITVSEYAFENIVSLEVQGLKYGLTNVELQ